MSDSTQRYVAIQTVATRTPRVFARPRGADGRVLTAKELFGKNTLDMEKLRQRLAPGVFQRLEETIHHNRPLARDVADAVAQVALEWAHERGATHFCHWFQPMTGLTAEKHDGFLMVTGGRRLDLFTGSQLIQSEPDASSFPSGGMRSTFEARGYTAWDPSSPLFVIERENGATLCVPSVFISYHGDALDKKTPLLRSMDAIGTQAVRLARALGDTDVQRVIVTAGPEQEYFLVDKAYAALRPDLLIAGRTLQGARPPKGQTLEDHYFGSIPTRVLAFMQELDSELYALGVPAKTRHNEVAPMQFEIAVVYSEANLAADHNQLVMEHLKKVAERHNFVALLHEKPFAGVNGSGKHLNWSLQDDLGRNWLEPSDSPASNLRFMAVLSAVMLGVHQHAAALRAAIASHGNDFRLGANEAPPAIISVFLGSQLADICDAVLEGRSAGEAAQAAIALGVGRLPAVARDTTDRNRTSPFAFTGNKFEFRAVGANSTISFPMTVLNAAVADGLRQLADRIHEAGGGEAGAWTAIRKTLQDTRAVRFEGNNYAGEWQDEAQRRGLPNARSSPDALAHLASPQAVALFTRHGIYNEAELASRYHVKLEQYMTSIDVEVDVLRGMVDQAIVPAALAERSVAADDLARSRQVVGEAALTRTTARFERLCRSIDDVLQRREDLDSAVANLHGEGLERARAYAQQLVPALEALRISCDQVEELVADCRWPLPRYREMLFQN